MLHPRGLSAAQGGLPSPGEGGLSAEEPGHHWVSLHSMGSSLSLRLLLELFRLPCLLSDASLPKSREEAALGGLFGPLVFL